METGHPALVNRGLSHKDTVAHAIARALQRHGVKQIFGQSLPSMLHLACEALGIAQIGYRTENAGGYMADGWARVSNKPAFLTAQNGPAAALLVAPLAEALKSSVPVVALVQDVDRQFADRNAFQELDHLQLFSSCAKWVRRVVEPGRAVDYLDLAIATACSGRPGPAVLLLPADLLLQKASEPLLARTHSLARFPLDRPVANPAAIEEAAQALAFAERPLVIAGGGVHLSDAAQELAALQESAHLPVATTVMGKGAVSELHPLSIGVVGYFMGKYGATHHQRSLVTDADVVLLVGARTNQNDTDSWKLYPSGARYIHLDVDGVEVGRNYEALRLVGDARESLAALRQRLSMIDLSKRVARRPQLQHEIKAGRDAYAAESNILSTSNTQPIRPERVMQELQRVLTPDSVVVADASYSSIWIANGLTALKAGMRFICPRGLAGIGWGFPMALGAKLARPAASVYAVVGDGGFGHVWSELETAVRMNIKVTVIVLNNGILGYQKHAENLKYGDHTSAVNLGPVDHAGIARMCGCVGIRVEDPLRLSQVFAEAQEARVTALIEVICDPNAFPPITSFDVARREAVSRRLAA